MKKITIVCGPTASGKSSLALQIAQKEQGSVVNADAMQIYKDLTIISARPKEEEMHGIPHLLYGYADAWTQGTVQDWLEKITPVLKEIKNPVIVGGTGMYISALVNGINDIPDVDETIRQSVRNMDIEEVKSIVKDCPFTDPQRLRRALEIQLTTGKPLSFFQNQPKKKTINADFQVIFLNPPRDILYKRCEQRFYQMIEQGGIEEVQKLMELKPTGGVLKAIGVPEIISYLEGNLSKEEMCLNAILSTRHYAKRQVTWFKHQIKSDIELTTPSDF